ncbi:MAG: AMP-binding protein, partial [Prosthecobacter sp.]|nr:AMP-binding protein [Prosthecobacter sp.]
AMRISRLMPAADFWNDESCHIARDPKRPENASGLEEWAAGIGMKKVCFFQTSGSEGRPKWVCLEKQAFLISGEAVNRHLASDKSDCWLVALPQHHVGGFAIQARAMLSGARIVSHLDRWQPESFYQACMDSRATLVSLVPTQVHDLVHAALRSPPSLRAVIVGGGSMSLELATAARSLGWPVLQSYGMTEAASQIATQLPHAPHRPMAVLPHWQTRLDEKGRLVIRGPALALGYVTQAPHKGWLWHPIGPELVTRDIVALNQDKDRCWLEFIGREIGFVKILGELVHLAPLQSKLNDLALVLNMPTPPVLVPLPDNRRETKLLLAAELHPNADKLLHMYNQAVEPLHQVSDLRTVSAIPYTALGKVDLIALIKELTTGG